MAEDNNDPVPQSAIPPKAVPPQIRPVAETGNAEESPTVRRQPVPFAGGASASAPRTVRLKPIGGGIPASPSMPRISPSAPVGTAAAADAIKRMTTHIAIMANENDPVTGKRRTGQIPVEGESGVKKATSALAALDGTATVKKVTSRIQMSATAIIPDLSDTPKTIKIHPLAGTQPVPLAEPPPVFGQPISQQAAGKSKTSRIPLESAMVVPQSDGAATAESSSGGAPKTIKLKRPGEMSTIKVSMPGSGTGYSQSQTADNSPITQKKTIRVKRPAMPVTATASPVGGADEGGVPTVAAMSSLEFASAAPERGTGWFIALAVACILLAIGLVGAFSLQLFSSRPHTELDPQFQQG